MGKKLAFMRKQSLPFSRALLEESEGDRALRPFLESSGYERFQIVSKNITTTTTEKYYGSDTSDSHPGNSLDFQGW